MGRYRFARAIALVVALAAGLLHAQQWHNLFPAHNGLAFGGGKFVAVSGDGVVRVSEDGVDWTQMYGLAGDRGLLSVGFGEDAGFLAAQSGTAVLRSADGMNWYPEPSSTQYPCRYLIHGAGTFIGVGDDGSYPVTFRHDGEEWLPVTNLPASTTSLVRAAFGGDRYVAVGNNIISSTVSISGGRSWTAASVSTPGGVGAVAFGGDGFVALGANGTAAYTSDDGAIWQTHTVSVPSGMADMTYGDGKFVAVGANGSAAFSANGTSWTAASQPPGIGENFVAVRYGNGVYVALGTRGAVYTSADGSNWTKRAAGRSMTYRQIIRGGDVYVAVGDSGVAVSSDGKNWSARPAGKMLRAVAYGGGRFVAVGDSGARYSSADGETWSDHSLSGDERNIMLKSIAFGDGAFVMGGRTPATLTEQRGGPVIYTSTDGQQWAEYTSFDLDGWDFPDFPVSIAFGNSRFVAADSNGNGRIKSTILNTVPAGKYWTNATLPAEAQSHRIIQIVYADGKFIALGTTGVGGGSAVVLSSTDGTSWTMVPGTPPANAKSVTYARSHYVAVADSGNMYATTGSGAAWHRLSKATNRNLTTIYNDGENMYAAGVSGAMLFSTENPVPVRHTAVPRKPSGKWGMTLDNTRRAPVVTLSFTPERPGTIALYTLSGRQIYKKSVGAGQRSVQLPGRITNGTVIVKYSGADGRTAVQRFQMVK